LGSRAGAHYLWFYPFLLLRQRAFLGEAWFGLVSAATPRSTLNVSHFQYSIHFLLKATDDEKG
jgi:hypothetical protein